MTDNKPKAKDGTKRGGSRPGAGRPKGAVDPVKAAIKQSIEEKAREYADDALRVLHTIAMDTLAPTAPRVTAAVSLLDRGHGKPGQTIKHQGDEDAPLNLGVVFVGTNPNDLIKDEEPEEGEGEE